MSQLDDCVSHLHTAPLAPENAAEICAPPLGAAPAITKLQSKADAIRAAELKRADAKLANLSQREIEAVERLSRGIVSKLLHGPMSALRSDDAPEKKKNALGVLKNMFGV